MRLQEGPAFSASIIAVGVGFLFYNQTKNLALALLLGLGLGLADYAILVWINSIKSKRK
ncbi:hypothetical protein DES40_1244 [Litorimonas taeanensis]|uniref:Uncharacterized protein n=1 Tax=Litorimonas taeanensis TaxID=568099 RepID=A0A420WLX1_9PROT|nr:hypothetical protein [Litorimonas taeanensis]RKQ71912.1 hypothetical protein DES40_1244 [Litorimonas taeanensis]